MAPGRLGVHMNASEIEGGLRELGELAVDEYHESIGEVLAGPNAATRLGRLIGILIKQPMADPVNLDTPSHRTRAYRAWNLKNNDDFRAAKAGDEWQFRLLDQIRVELAPEVPYIGQMTTYELANFAQDELGFFGLFGQSVRKYLCGDPDMRRKVDLAFSDVTRTNGKIKVPTPEALVGAGGLTLGTYLVQAVPVLGVAGAPVIAGLVLLVYLLGMDAFCVWLAQIRTDEDEK